MKIRTQFIVSVTLFGAILAATAWIAAATSVRLAELDRQGQLAMTIATNAAELSYEANRYLFDPSVERLGLWEESWQDAVDAAADLGPIGYRQRAIADAIDSDLQRQRAVFLETATALAAGETDAATVSMSWNRLAVQNASLAFDAQQLLRIVLAERRTVRQRFVALTAVLLAVFAVYLLVNVSTVQRRWLRSLAELTEGTRVVALGDLSHTIPIRQNDEIGDLAAEFNRMTATLRGEVASRTEVERERGRFEALLTVASTLTSGVGLDDVLESVCAGVLDATTHTRATLVLHDEGRSALRIVTSCGKDVLPQRAIPMDGLSAPARESMTSRTATLLDYDALAGPERGIGAELDSHLAFAVPLVYKDRLVGVLVVDDPGDRREFDPQERELLEGIAAHAAVAIENARLYEAEHRIAETLQETLVVLPERVPGVAFSRAYESATFEAGRVGGDFFDVFEVQPGLVALSLGDVSGKGVQAAVTTSLVRTALRVHLLDGLTAAQVVGKANRVLGHFVEKDSFVTLWFGLLDVPHGRLRYVCAGHPPALVLTAEGELRPLASTDPFIGAFAEATFAEQETWLGPGDRMVLYSDGIIEARSPEGVLLGEQGLHGMLQQLSAAPTEDIAREVMDAVKAFSNGVLRDDAAILVVEPTALENGPRQDL